jgi:Bacterial DNA-binding protein
MDYIYARCSAKCAKGLHLQHLRELLPPEAVPTNNLINPKGTNMAADKKKAAKAAPKKKAAAKKAAPGKAAPKAAAKAAAKPTPVTDRWSKTQIQNEIAARVAISRKQVAAIFEELDNILERHIAKGGPGSFVLPGLLKIERRIKKAVPKGLRRIPGSNEMRMMPAKPASVTVKVRPLKRLKEMAPKKP